ncbi:hypothetical protein INR77_03055 [Erythrobacter sp. SCSIO 43205]|uniref:hypothetical protein n=1 Tax=Erythrobacter sp. SCSIO 43205 TaxID=2779361 RepID=UPI001CA7DD9B|nr:hypothetical protein [Erythrobacter sp. SCSIO 43205]UAB78719.1 hypothetical protein INR77_03055 [Erythrobacter sp. SCSIO 43205]
MIVRSAHGWQLILADLSLILFLVTLSALVSSSMGGADEAQGSASGPYVAPAQALYRKVEGGPDLDEWLSEQVDDPRAALTIIAHHSSGERDAVWEKALTWAELAQQEKVPVRVVINEADNSEIYASLAYDAPELER